MTNDKCIHPDGHDWDITIWDDGERRCEHCIHCGQERVVKYHNEVDEAAQHEIRKRYDDIKATIQMHRNAIEQLFLNLEQMQRACTHPHKYTYSASGELGVRCPDCGWST